MNSNRNTTPKNLRIGMHVEINPQADRTRKKIVQGIITEILTKSKGHPHGVLVLLESGEKGRVKAIIDQSDKNRTVEHKASTKEKVARTTLNEYIKEGENHHIEYKSSALWSVKFTNDDIKSHKPQSSDLHTYGKNTSKVIIAKALAGFLNTDGGTLIIGIKENKNNDEDELIGIETEYANLKDQCQDGYRRMLVDLIKDYFPADIFNHLNQYIQIKFEEVKGNVICGITAVRSDQRVFLKLKATDHFYIRTDASTRELHGEEILDYCIKRFK
ncbi:MAG: DUF2196 domain-containing protein [Chlorobi bacterium]|nr:DUF2196 domain-containing protein [Chlorobiota bacterium]